MEVLRTMGKNCVYREECALFYSPNFGRHLCARINSRSLFYLATVVTDQGSLFESRTRQTEDEKLSWLFSGLNCERMGVGYVAELHSHAKKALVWNRATVQF
jgi:hypothetical protein